MLTVMGMIETIVAGVITTVVSSLLVEWIRETRKNGKQFLERLVDFVVDFMRSVIELIREAL